MIVAEDINIIEAKKNIEEMRSKMELMISHSCQLTSSEILELSRDLDKLINTLLDLCNFKIDENL